MNAAEEEPTGPAKIVHLVARFSKQHVKPRKGKRRWSPHLRAKRKKEEANRFRLDESYHLKSSNMTRNSNLELGTFEFEFANLSSRAKTPRGEYLTVAQTRKMSIKELANKVNWVIINYKNRESGGEEY